MRPRVALKLTSSTNAQWQMHWAMLHVTQLECGPQHTHTHSHTYTHTQLHTLNGYEISGTWRNQGHCRSVDCKLCPKDNKDGTNRKALMQLHTYTHRHSHVLLVLIYANEEQVPVKEGRGKGNYIYAVHQCQCGVWRCIYQCQLPVAAHSWQLKVLWFTCKWEI